MPNKKNNQKRTESIIVALIIVLVVLLVLVAGVLIYRNNSTPKGSFGSGGGGGTLPPPPISKEEVLNPGKNIGEENVESKSDSYYEKPTETPAKNEALDKKNAFLDKADDIEWYSETYLETAETQSEINSESSIVYKKWDALLNEVYQYLKTIMSDSEFKQLQEDEIAWITKKEKAIDAAGAEWEGGSGEPMARNLTAIQYTEERCYYLISLIN